MVRLGEDWATMVVGEDKLAVCVLATKFHAKCVLYKGSKIDTDTTYSHNLVFTLTTWSRNLCAGPVQCIPNGQLSYETLHFHRPQSAGLNPCN